MSPSTVITQTRAFILENFLYTRPDTPIGDDEGLVERRIIDSMGMVELVSFVQDQFGIMVHDDEITEANLGSLSRIAQFVISKRAAAAAA